MVEGDQHAPVGGHGCPLISGDGVETAVGHGEYGNEQEKSASLDSALDLIHKVLKSPSSTKRDTIETEENTRHTIVPIYPSSCLVRQASGRSDVRLK